VALLEHAPGRGARRRLAAPAFAAAVPPQSGPAEAQADAAEGVGGEEGEDEEEPSVWTSSLDALWAGWEDPTPENALVLFFSAVAADTVVLFSLRLVTVCIAVLFTALKYSAVALILVLALVFFA